jgi:hypothetical protein
MERIREITITHYRRRRVITRRRVMDPGCAECGSRSEMMSVAAAASLTGLSRSTLYKWMGSRLVHATRSSAGRLQVCRRSLLSRVIEKGVSALDSG